MVRGFYRWSDWRRCWFALRAPVLPAPFVDSTSCVTLVGAPTPADRMMGGLLIDSAGAPRYGAVLITVGCARRVRLIGCAGRYDSAPADARCAAAVGWSVFVGRVRF